MQQAVVGYGEIGAFTWIQSINADVYSGLASAWSTASSQHRWHRQLQSGCTYSLAYISFLTDSVNPFVSETQECHINLLFHCDNCVFVQNSVQSHKTNSLSTGLLEVIRSFDCHNYWMIHHLETVILMVFLLCEHSATRSCFFFIL